MKLPQFLRRLFNRSTPPLTAPPAAPLPENWLTDPHFDVSLLNPEQLEQKEAYHLGNIARMEAENAEREAQPFEFQLDQQRLRGAHQHQHWVDKLCRLYGEEIGTKLVNHEIEPGMTRDQLLFTYGVPEPENIGIQGNKIIYRYGSVKRGAYFELTDNIITQVAIMTPPPYPPHAFDDYDEAALALDNP